jgi:hypothetical protein
MTSRRIFALVVLPVASAVVGCGNGLADVSGTVTLDGKPLQGGPQMDATVSFVREDGHGTPAVGFIDESGRYTLKLGAQTGIAPGTYLLGLSAKKITMPATREDMPKATLITPPKYESVTESGFRADLKPGSNTFDFALESKPGQ